MREPGDHRGAEVVIPVRERPAAVFEATLAVLVGSARRLHNAVEGQEGVQSKAHRVSSGLVGLESVDGREPLNSSA